MTIQTKRPRYCIQSHRVIRTLTLFAFVIQAKKKTKKNTAVQGQKFNLENALEAEGLKLQIEALNIQHRVADLLEIDIKARIRFYETKMRFLEASRVKLDHEVVKLVQEATNINLRSFSLANELVAAGMLDSNIFQLPSLDVTPLFSAELPSLLLLELPSIQLPAASINRFGLSYIDGDVAGISVQWRKPGRLPTAPNLNAGDQPIIY
ncbi:hypothetical protein BJ138DRAFT_1140753 [Hygrophoropsis aurantiaca]|uniref:Uncharacterized protein n=1 Tax=Hygrophoropsis aurantiaca TaxID=72124 RepID=A0ACB8AU49_9AGAM|nr:hypothetical protein BJ138DRAFT_1140753 [Hygrophoropsis aurantiaca]